MKILLAFSALLPLCAQTSTQPRPVWHWDLSEIDATVNKVRAGRDLTPKQWPDGARVAVALSFDVDAETGFLRSGLTSPQPLSRGQYGPRVGVPRILDLSPLRSAMPKPCALKPDLSVRFL